MSPENSILSMCVCGQECKKLSYARLAYELTHPKILFLVLYIYKTASCIQIINISSDLNTIDYMMMKIV